MPMPSTVKKEIKTTILSLVEKRGPQDRIQLITGLSLETGFTKGKVEEILNDLAVVNQVRIDGDIVQLPERQNMEE